MLVRFSRNFWRHGATMSNPIRDELVDKYGHGFFEVKVEEYSGKKYGYYKGEGIGLIDDEMAYLDSAKPLDIVKWRVGC